MITLVTSAVFAVLLLALVAAVSHAIRSDIFGLDRGLAAMFFHARHGETISLIVAQWQADGSRAGCRWCRFLSIAVERDHCVKQLDNTAPATPIFSGLRAGVCLAALYLVPSAVLLGAWVTLYGLIGFVVR